MAACAFTLDVGVGPDLKPTSGDIRVARLNGGIDPTDGKYVLPEWSQVSVIEKGSGGAFKVLDLEQGVTYLFDVRRLVGVDATSTAINKGAVAKTMPNTSTAKFSTTADVIPVYPSAGILGDDLVNGLAENEDSDFHATLQELFAQSEGGSVADGAMALLVGNPATATGSALTAKIASIKAWAKDVDTIVTGAVTVDGNDLVTTAVVEWPDGLPGVLTIDSRQALTNAVTAYHVTHVDGGTTMTYTQPGITRNANGAATNVPQIVVS